MPGDASAVDASLAELDEDKRATLSSVRASVLALLPEAEDCLAWSMPAFRWRGKVLLCYAAAKRHCAVYPMSRRVIETMGEELAGYSLSAGTIRFPVDSPLPEPLLARIIELRTAEIGGG